MFSDHLKTVISGRSAHGMMEDTQLEVLAAIPQKNSRSLRAISSSIQM
jgi:hypothetical protein